MQLVILNIREIVQLIKICVDAVFASRVALKSCARAKSDDKGQICEEIAPYIAARQIITDCDRSCALYSSLNWYTSANLGRHCISSDCIVKITYPKQDTETHEAQSAQPKCCYTV